DRCAYRHARPRPDTLSSHVGRRCAESLTLRQPCCFFNPSQRTPGPSRAMRTELSVPFQTSKKISFAGQISLIALLAGLGAGCSNVLPMREPIFTGSTANQQQILSG